VTIKVPLEYTGIPPVVDGEFVFSSKKCKVPGIIATVQ